MNYKTIKTQDFILASIFLLLLVILFTFQEQTVLLEMYLFGLILLLILGGFFLYIFTPEIVSQGRHLLNSEIRILLPPLSISLVIGICQIFFSDTTDFVALTVNSVLIVIFVLIPTIIYLIFPHQTRKGLSFVDVCVGLWVWLPIEFDLLDPFLGFIDLGNIPFQTLLAVFAFLYALIFVRDLTLGLTFTLSSSDLKYVNTVTLILTLIVLPLGIVTYFLAPVETILDNLVLIFSKLPFSLLEIILTFLTIFLATALIEELFFRGFIYQLLAEKLQAEDSFLSWGYLGVIALTGLIAVTPWIDDVFELLSQIFPFLIPVKEDIGVLAKPLGEKEGVAWPFVQSLPLEVLYLGLALLIGLSAFVIIHKTQDPLITALLLSSILFGWAHFEDARYIFFATISGCGYGWTYSKTNKIVPAALVHTTINTVWGLILGF